MKTILVLAVLFVLATGCGSAPASLTTPDGVPVSCELLDRSDTETVVRFSDPDIAAPGGTACVSLGGGVFDCKPTWCTVVLYAAPSEGNACPECPVSE